MPRARTALEVLAKHQWPQYGDGVCAARDDWGLAVGETPEDEQMAAHQIIELVKAGFVIVRGHESEVLGVTVCRCDGEAHEHVVAPGLCPEEPVR